MEKSLQTEHLGTCAHTHTHLRAPACQYITLCLMPVCVCIYIYKYTLSVCMLSRYTIQRPGLRPPQSVSFFGMTYTHSRARAHTHTDTDGTNRDTHTNTEYRLTPPLTFSGEDLVEDEYTGLPSQYKIQIQVTYWQQHSCKLTLGLLGLWFGLVAISISRYVTERPQ